jgi:hypothetical protein
MPKPKAYRPKTPKKIRGLMNQGTRKQLEQLGIDPGPSPRQQAKKRTRRKFAPTGGKPSTGSK